MIVLCHDHLLSGCIMRVLKMVTLVGTQSHGIFILIYSLPTRPMFIMFER